MPERERSSSSQRKKSVHAATMGDRYRYRAVSTSGSCSIGTDSRAREIESQRREKSFSHNSRMYPGYSPSHIRQEYTGPFADQRDQLIATSVEVTDSSGSGSSYSSVSESTSCWESHHDEKPRARNPGMVLDQKLPSHVASLKHPPIQRSPCFPTVEVAPGVSLRLRGAAETTWAIQNDFYIPIECVCCTQTILCIQDADYVLCPDCRVVGPIRPPQERSNGGVGLGCRPDAFFARGSS